MHRVDQLQHTARGIFDALPINVADPKVFIGLLIGGAVPFLFSSLAINAVSRTAGVVVQEVRRQFADGKIMRGEKEPDHGPVIDICTAASLRELTTPALLAVLTPVIIGFGVGFKALGAFLAAVILVGQLMANYLSNAGGAWDNAKKYIEDGNEGGKGSDGHKAAVIADTVGDPFKDTAGPALNPLIKVMNLVSLLILPAILSSRFVHTHTINGVGGFGHIIDAEPTGLARAIAGVALVVLIISIAYSKRAKGEFGGGDIFEAASGVEERSEPAEAVEEVLVGASSAVKVIPAPAPAKVATARKTTARKAPAKKAAPVRKATVKKSVTKKAAPAKKATKKRS